MAKKIKILDKDVTDMLIQVTHENMPLKEVNNVAMEAIAIKELFRSYIYPEEINIIAIAKQIEKIHNFEKGDSATVTFFGGENLKLILRYICLIHPFFSAIKRTINQLQRSVLKKYGIKLSGRKGLTYAFFDRMEKEKSSSPELKIMRKYMEFIQEIKDTRDNTEHLDPSVAIKYNRKLGIIGIPIYEKMENNVYREKCRVHFFSYMEESIKQIITLVNELKPYLKRK